MPLLLVLQEGEPRRSDFIEIKILSKQVVALFRPIIEDNNEVVGVVLREDGVERVLKLIGDLEIKAVDNDANGELFGALDVAIHFFDLLKLLPL